MCAKCGRKLHQIGVDYRRPGFAYHCPSCGELHPAAIERWSCNLADHVFQLEEAIPEKIYSYTLSEEKREQALIIFEYIQPITETFKKLGYEAETFHIVKGTSGVSHLVDIYAYKESPEPSTSIIRVLTNEGIKPEEVLKHYAISLDINASKAVIIAVPKLDKESEVYSEKLNLHVIEGDNFETVVQQLISMVNEWE